MKRGKILILISLIALGTTATAYAEDVYKWFQAKEIKVYVNGSGLNMSGYMTEEGVTYLPMREIADTLQGMVVWDQENEIVKINKPNVHISLLQVKENNNFIPFGDVEKGQHEFVIFTQVDSLYNKISSIKATIESPFGEEVYSYEDEITSSKENLWFTTPSIQINFEQVGKYTVKIYMKKVGDSSYSLVSERVIRSLAP